MLLQLSPLLHCANPNLLLSPSPISRSRASQSHHPLFLFCNNNIGPLSSSSSHTQSNMTGISRSFFSAPVIEPNDDPDPNPEGEDSQSLVVVSFYKFADFPDHAHMRKPLKDLCQQLVLSSLSLSVKGLSFFLCFQCKIDCLQLTLFFSDCWVWEWILTKPIWLLGDSNLILPCTY